VAIALMAGGGDAPGNPVEAARTAAATDAASEPAPAAPDPATTPSAATTPGTATTPDPATTGDPASAPAPDPGTAGGRGGRGTPGRGRAPSFDQARRMTDRAWVEITRGRPEKAVALMERAVPVLAGSGDLYEGYARYNLGRGLLDLGRCGDAVPHLEDALAQPGSAAQTAERDEMLGRARACAT